MALTEDLKKEIGDLAERFVGAFVKSVHFPESFTVNGEFCDSLDAAVLHSLKKCGRLNVSAQDGDEQEKLLKNALEQAIKKLS